MNKSYPNERDCEHGSMRGKCDICEYEQDIKELEWFKRNATQKIAELESHSLGLTKTLVELERVNSEHGKNLLKIIDYCQKNKIGRLGRSYIDELLEFSVKLREKNTELEKKLSHAETMGDKAQAIRDLEQQVVGIHKALAWVRKNKSSDSYSRARLEKYALSLLDETEQLKE